MLKDKGKIILFLLICVVLVTVVTEKQVGPSKFRLFVQRESSSAASRPEAKAEATPEEDVAKPGEESTAKEVSEKEGAAPGNDMEVKE